MTRSVDETRRPILLDRAVDYVCEHGLSELSLRPLAKALGSSPRVLLYYFNSKEELVVAIIACARARQRLQFASLKLGTTLSASEFCRTCWSVMSDPRNVSLYRLWFEVYGLALQDRARFPGFLESAVEDWLAFLESSSTDAGESREQARAWATMIVAGFRGFLLDLCASEDRKRVDAAVELWLSIVVDPPDEAPRRER